MKYWEQPPIARLARHVECFWFVSDADGSATGATERVLPDGCLEWIFHLGVPFERATLSGVWEEQPRSFIVGQLTRFLLLQARGRVEIMGVRFKPGGAYRFLQLPLESLTDNNVPTADVWGRKGNYLEQAVLEAGSSARRQQLVEEFLLIMLQETAPRRRLEATIAEIIRSRGQTRVHELADQIGLSSRQLEREFRAGVGLSPKALARILRFQNLLRLVGEGPLRAWAYLAAEGGYADQPHMVREFREFAGQSPSERQVTVAGELATHFISPQRLAALLGPSGQ
jgi:AraC-like DNA-binding protein